MSRKTRKRDHSENGSRFVKILLVLVLAGLFLSLAYFLPNLNGPKAVKSGDITVNTTIPSEMVEVLAQSERHERLYRAAIEVRTPNEEDLRSLNMAIEQLNTYIANTHNQPDINARMVALQTLLQDALADPLFKESRAAEDESVIFEQRKAYVEARAKIREAIDLQARINKTYPLSRFQNVHRVSQLERVMQVLIARPILEESHEREDAGEKAEVAGNWSQALEAYRRAMELQQQLNIGYVQLRFADVGRTQKLQQAIASLESVGLFDKVNAAVQQGSTAMDAAKVRDAAEAFQEAYYTQQELNRDYPQSRFADAGQLDKLRQKLQSAQSKPLADDIAQSAENVRIALRARDHKQAAFLLNSLQPKVLSFKESFPLSQQVDEGLLFEIQFLYVKRADLSRLQGDFLNGAQALASGNLMLRTEIPQGLFSQIAGSNPSRNRGDSLPVETLNYAEALDFCKRASFLLGQPVRLPTQAEYREALGDLRYADLNALSWNAENANGKTHSVGTKQANPQGFFDLLGNVGEWLWSEDELKEAVVIGGNILTPVDSIGDVPASAVSKNERNRLNGFRVVIEPISKTAEKKP